MSENKEGLSALVDGQAGDFEVRRLLSAMDDDASLSATWRRYQVTRSILKRDIDASSLIDISDSVSRALVQEPSHQVSDHTQRATPKADSGAQPIWRSLASMAVAASVTALVIFGANNFTTGTEDAVTPAPRMVYSQPMQATSGDFVRAQFGERSVAAPVVPQPDVIRLSQGLKRYIDQHQQLLEVRQPQWQSAWVPEGYRPVSHELVPHGEVLLYSNGETSFSVTVEEVGYQRSEAGVAQAEGLIAVGRRQGDHFVTVVGDVPLMIADRIASNVTLIR